MPIESGHFCGVLERILKEGFAHLSRQRAGECQPGIFYR
jgi:hypothetical protein